MLGTEYSDGQDEYVTLKSGPASSRVEREALQPFERLWDHLDEETDSIDISGISPRVLRLLARYLRDYYAFGKEETRGIAEWERPYFEIDFNNTKSVLDLFDLVIAADRLDIEPLIASAALRIGQISLSRFAEYNYDSDLATRTDLVWDIVRDYLQQVGIRSRFSYRDSSSEHPSPTSSTVRAVSVPAQTRLVKPRFQVNTLSAQTSTSPRSRARDASAAQKHPANPRSQPRPSSPPIQSRAAAQTRAASSVAPARPSSPGPQRVTEQFSEVRAQLRPPTAAVQTRAEITPASPQTRAASPTAQPGAMPLPQVSTPLITVQTPPAQLRATTPSSQIRVISSQTRAPVISVQTRPPTVSI